MNIKGRIKVRTLKAQFKEEFGLTIRVYDGRSFADDDSTLASIRKGDSKGGEFSPHINSKIGNFEDRIKDLFGLKIQISGSDNSYLCDNDLTLKAALDEDENKLGRKEKKASKGNDTLDTKDINSDVTRFFVLNIKGTGSECTYGIVTDDKDKSKLQELAKTGELELENYFNDGEILHFEYTQILCIYGPSIEEARISLTTYEDEEAQEVKEEIFCDEDIDSLSLHTFQHSNPNPISDAFNHEKYKNSLQFGGYKVEKRIYYPAFISLDENEEFELNNVFIGYMSLEDTLSVDTLVSIVLYIRPEVSRRIFVLHTDNHDLSDWSQEDVSEILREVYENLDDMLPELKTILSECECEVGEIEGKGVIEESFVQLCDAEDNLIFEKTY